MGHEKTHKAARAVCHNGRWIDYDQAVRKMDEKLLQDASAIADEDESHRRRWNAREEHELMAKGGVEAEYAVALQALPDSYPDRRHRDIFEVYLYLHRKKHGSEFDPGLPEVAEPETPPSFAAFWDLFRAYRGRLPFIRALDDEPGTALQPDETGPKER